MNVDEYDDIEGEDDFFNSSKQDICLLYMLFYGYCFRGNSLRLFSRGIIPMKSVSEELFSEGQLSEEPFPWRCYLLSLTSICHRYPFT